MKKILISESEKTRILNLHEIFRKKILKEDFSGEPFEGYDDESSCKRDLPSAVVQKAGLDWYDVRNSWGSDGSARDNLDLRDAFCDGWRPSDSKTFDPMLGDENDNDDEEDKNTEDNSQEPTSTPTTKDDMVDKALKKMMKKYNIKITQTHIDNEFNQEGKIVKDAGGVNDTAEKAVEKLISYCKTKNTGLSGLGIISGYRSYDYQVDNFGKKASSTRGVDDTQKWNALPGFSQHHSGKAFDIFSVDPTWWNERPKVKNCVANNAKTYGLKVTYTPESTEGKLRGAEPWHLYYVG